MSTDSPAPPTIQLEQLLKREGWVPTGGMAKVAIQGGEVTVNGEVETRRKKKLHVGDVVRLGADEHTVSDDDVSPPR
jgi:ribosome-associated protein